MNCLNCNKELDGKWVKKYCSKSCAAIINNRLKPRRKKREKPKCRTCDNKTEQHHVAHCSKCIKIGKHLHGSGPVNKQTIEFASRRGGANRYDSIRAHARNVYKNELKGCCEKCGYNKHVELCHIKAISLFPKETLVEVVNSRSNILFLCPNCHWEHDH